VELAETAPAWRGPVEAVDAGEPYWFTDRVLVGRGGSSLAPEVIAHAMRGEGLPLTLVDTTHPGTLRDLEWLRPANTIFVVSSKSGTTVETLSLFRHFWSRTAEVVDDPGEHFIAITDPGSPLAEFGRERGFRAVFEAPPDVGGRFSALSPFGLVPAALAGADVAALLAEAAEAADACRDDVHLNPGFVLGAALGELALAGRDKVTFAAASDWNAFPDWAEQLLAESTGKEGRGIVPVVGEPPRPPHEYGQDRVFVGLLLGGDAARETEQWGEADETPDLLDALEAAGHPTLRIRLERPEELGALFFVCEVGVAMAGAALGIHPFNQPDVQLAKRLARRAMAGDGEPEGDREPEERSPGVEPAEDAQVSEADEIDQLYVATVSPSDEVPNSACTVATKIGNPRLGGFAINAACAGFVYGVGAAWSAIVSGMAERVLVVSGDALTRLVDYTDVRTAVLFGDGAGAVVLERSETDHGVLGPMVASGWFARDPLYLVGQSWRDDGDRVPILHMEGGPRIVRNAIVKMAEVAEQALHKAGLDWSDVDFVIPHQANARITQGLEQRLELPKGRVVHNIVDYGNMSASTVAVTLDEVVRGKHGPVPAPATIVLTSIGGGYTMAAAVVRI